MGAGIPRRRFLAGTSAAGAALAVPWFVDTRKLPAFLQQSVSSPAFQQSMPLQKFITELRGLNEIPVAAPDGFRAPVTGVTHYSVTAEQFQDTLHPALGPTTLWGYKPAVVAEGSYTGGQRHLGGIIVAQHGVPVQITFTNKLPSKHILPVDKSANFPDAQKHENMTSTHLHGGYTPWMSDGIPTGWYTPEGVYGPSIPLSIYRILNPDLQPGQAEHYYTIHVSARMAWYHDHAHDLTRLNVYAGLASAFFIRDDFEKGLIQKGLPEYMENGGNEIPIVIQDKIFVGPDIATDPTWPGPTTPGSLWYAHYYDPNRWPPDTGTTISGPLGSPPDPSCIPEFFGDTMLANGTVYPETTVQARRYRLRVLNACNARFLNLQLYVADDTTDGLTLVDNGNGVFVPTNEKGPDFLVLGNEGGFLPHPVLVASNTPLDTTTNPNDATTWGGSLVTSPAERWDMLVDFTGFEGKSVILYNDSPAPFPGGDPRNDYFLGAPDGTAAPGAGQPTVTTAGYGPDTRQIMRFNVVAANGTDQPLGISPATDLTAGNDPLPLPLGDTALPAGVPVRRLILDEVTDGYGRLIQKIGTDTSASVSQGGLAFMDPPTEVVTAGTSEVWQFVNLTADTHPIHFHLVNVQIISRQPFDTTANYTGGAPPLTGSPRPPDGYETGWKDTVRMNPGEVTNILIPFSLPNVPFEVPVSPRTGGYEYVYHCHILEHEEHDMMRPMVIKAVPKPPTPKPPTPKPPKRPKPPRVPVTG